MELVEWNKRRGALIRKIMAGKEVTPEAIIKYELDRYVEKYEDMMEHIMKERSSVNFD